MHSRSIVLAALLTLAPAAWGQPAKAEASESDAAMERAKRAAAGPLKAIQQASRINRRRGEPEPAPAPGAAVIAAAAAAAPVATPASPARAAEAPAAALVLDVDARVPAPAEVAAVDAITPAALAPAAASTLPPPGTVTQTLLDTLPVQPKLREMVEPGIPPSLLAQGPRGVEVEAELSLRADGSVAAVTLLPPVPRAWQRHIVSALERWRYEPMAEARVHRVRLVFSNPGDS